MSTKFISLIEQKKYPYKKTNHFMLLLNKNNHCKVDKLSKPNTDLEFEQFKQSLYENKKHSLIKEINLEKIIDDDNTIFI